MFVMENWGWPQWVIVVLVLLEIGVSAARLGKKVKYDPFGKYVVERIIQTIILACGGFYRIIRWPQVVWIVILTIDIGLNYRVQGEEHEVSLLLTLISEALAIFLLAKAGFFA